MQFTEGDLSSFKEIYEEEFGVKLTPEQTLEEATQVINVLEVLLADLELDETG